MELKEALAFLRQEKKDLEKRFVWAFGTFLSSQGLIMNMLQRQSKFYPRRSIQFEKSFATKNGTNKRIGGQFTKK